jgi:hypothetical protein
MPFLDDFMAAVQAYPTASVILTFRELASVDNATSPLGGVNVGETWRFRVRVHNTGYLNMTNVSLRIEGANGTKVSTMQAGPFGVGPVVVPSLSVQGHDGETDTVNLYFLAPESPRVAGTPLVRIYIASFYVNLDLILNNQMPVPPPVPVSYSARVYPR